MMIFGGADQRDNLGGADQRDNLGGADRRDNSGGVHRNFRFQVISITAVFAAMGIGIALGTVAHNGPASASLRADVSELNERNDQLRADADRVKRDAGVREKFAEELVPAVLTGRLVGVKVLIVSTPTAADSVGGVRRMLTVAGASLTGTLEVTAKFTDPRYDNELLDLARTVLPSSVVGPVPAGFDGVGATSALLSYVLLKRTNPVTEQDMRTVLTSYRSQGYLRGTEGLTTAADVVVVVSGPPVVDEYLTRRGDAMRALVTQFDKAGNVMVAATNDAGAGNLVAQVRHDPRLRLTVSTVDNVGTPQGRLVAAWAAVDQIAGKTGHYGVGEGATLLPESARQAP
ncbi:MAG: hypothetical protein QOE61_2877 [Micromonosporaceae bacterium]|jgi:hypothetical protein|nr:hypothetical protein [Micromonosporaceae bacterium]